jgi:hypothetical protein
VGVSSMFLWMTNFRMQSKRSVARVTLAAYLSPSLSRGCQMVYFQTKNSNLGKFWRGLIE